MHMTTTRWACFAAALVALGGCTLPPTGADENRTRPDRAYRRHLRRESQLRQSLRLVSRRQRHRQRHAGAIHAGRPRRQAVRDAAAGVEGQGSRPGVSTRPAESAVPHRCAADQPAAVDGHPRSRPQVLSQSGADRRRPQRSLRRRERRRCADDGLLRWIEAAGVEAGRSNTRWPTISSWGRSAARILNHHWLICACTPVDREAPAKLRAQVDERGWLKTRPGSPSSVLAGAARVSRRRSYRPMAIVSEDDPAAVPAFACCSGEGRRCTAADPANTRCRRRRSPPSATRCRRRASPGRGMPAPGTPRCRMACSRRKRQRKVICHPAKGAPNFVAHHQPFNYFARLCSRDRRRAPSI